MLRSRNRRSSRRSEAWTLNIILGSPVTFITSLTLGVLARYDSRPSDILDRIPATQGSGSGILDSLGPEPTPAPAEDVVPTGGETPAEGGAAAPAPAAEAPANSTGVPTGQ